jgi:methionine-rich copper-binding protein CopC
MNIKPLFLSLALAASAALAPISSMAHAMLEKSSPANGATVKPAPKTIDLVFGHPTRLTRFKLVSGAQEIPVTFDTTAAATTRFSIAVPALLPGNYQVSWSSLSSDGHAMTGKLSFTVSGN